MNSEQRTSQDPGQQDRTPAIVAWISIYLLISLRVVYQQGWLLTLASSESAT